MQPSAELWLLIEPVTDLPTLEHAEEPTPQNVPGMWEFTIRSVRCKFYDFGMSGARPQLAILSPDKSCVISFMQPGMTLADAKTLAAECVDSLLGAAQPLDSSDGTSGN